MRRVVATIVTLSFLFALSATSGLAALYDGPTTTVSQAHPAHLAPTLTADVPLIQKDGDLDPVLIASYVLDSVPEAPYLSATPFARYLDASPHSHVPLYLVARRLQI